MYRAAFNVAVERRLLTHSPLDGVRLFDEEKNRKAPRVLSFAEEQRILMCCDIRLRLIVTVLLYTGMRVGIEALRIKWTDVDFEEAVITVTQSKTAAGLRALPMTGFVASELQKWHAATNGISEYVFFNPQRSSAHIHSVKTAWHNALKLAGDPSVPHLPVSPLFRDQTGRAGCVGHNHGPTARACAASRTPVLYGTSSRIFPRGYQSAGKIAQH